jgi:hypothetical protein
MERYGQRNVLVRFTPQPPPPGGEDKWYEFSKSLSGPLYRSRRLREETNLLSGIRTQDCLIVA